MEQELRDLADQAQATTAVHRQGQRDCLLTAVAPSEARVATKVLRVLPSPPVPDPSEPVRPDRGSPLLVRPSLGALAPLLRDRTSQGFRWNLSRSSNDPPLQGPRGPASMRLRSRRGGLVNWRYPVLLNGSNLRCSVFPSPGCQAAPPTASGGFAWSSNRGTTSRGGESSGSRNQLGSVVKTRQIVPLARPVSYVDGPA